MADAEQVAETNTAASLMEQLGKACLELEALKNVSEDQVQWTDIKELFHDLEAGLKKKSEELGVKEKEFEAKEYETRALIAEKEADVAAKEQELLDSVQELKDSAFASLAQAIENFKPVFLEPVDSVENSENKVRRFVDVSSVPEEGSSNKTGETVEPVIEVNPRPVLIHFCKQMDAKGLLDFTMKNQEILSVIRDELPIALESASEPARLVLDSLEGFFPTYQSFEPVNLNDAALRGMRQSCIAFLQATVTFLAKADHGPDYFLKPEIKQQAKAIADEWKARLVRLGLNVVNSDNELEAEAFLLLLATFKFASEFDEEELCKFVLVDAANRQTPEVCRSLGLAHKIPDVVEMLINTGRRVEAVHFIQAFNLTERFPVVPLLKTYLKDMRRNSQGKKGGNSQIDVNAQELEALTAVVRCITEYKLESEYPLEPLRKRLAQLERSKTDKKRSMDYYSKFLPPKKVRSNGGFLRHRGCAVTASVSQIPPVYVQRQPEYEGGVADRYPHAAPTAYNYPIPMQSNYAHQTSDQRTYYYPPDDRVAPSPYTARPPTYDRYTSTWLQPSDQPYM